MEFNLESLKSLERRWSATEGVGTSELSAQLSNLFHGERNPKDSDDFRQGTRPWKKLRDEVSPVSRFLSVNNLEGNVHFPLNNDPPDAWFMPKREARIGIEVTRSLGRTDYVLAKEMVSKGEGRGFLGLQDGAPRADFDKAMHSPRIRYKTSQALISVSKGVTQCLKAKNKIKYEGMWLLILASLNILPRERWEPIIPDLRQKAAPMPFSQVHVFDSIGEDSWGFQIK